MEKQTKTSGGGGGGDDSFLLLLPEDCLIQNILVRLPVVSLLRFKSVCKSWRDLIQTTFFIDLHTTITFNSSSSSKLGDSFILQASRVAGSEFYVFSCESAAGYGSDVNPYRGNGDKKTDDDEEEEEVVFKVDKLGHPLVCHYDFSNKISPTDMVGSCNGLICLHDSNLRNVFLCNPATRQSRILPEAPSLTESSYRVFLHLVAFGFDVKTKDYKVLLITYFTPMFGQQQQEHFCRVHVYSLSTDSWRLLEGINSLPGLPVPEHHGLYLNGSYFFVGSKIPSAESLSYDNCLIISFDYTKEIFNTTQFPDHDDDVVQRRWYLSCLGEKLALFDIRGYKYGIRYGDDDWEGEVYNGNYAYVHYGHYVYEDFGMERHLEEGFYENLDHGNEDCEIWVLNEHGGCTRDVIKESWTKLHCFQIKRRRGREWIIPRGILNNGEFALLETRTSKVEEKKKMQLYNLVTKEAMDFLVCIGVKTVEVYKPSLVSIIGGNGTAAAAAATESPIE